MATKAKQRIPSIEEMQNIIIIPELKYRVVGNKLIITSKPIKGEPGVEYGRRKK